MKTNIYATQSPRMYSQLLFVVAGWVSLVSHVFCCFFFKFLSSDFKFHRHHHQVPDLEETLVAMPLQISLSSDNFKKFKPLLCPPVDELQRLSRNVILCLPLSRLPSTFPVKDKNSKPLRLGILSLGITKA